MGRGVVVALDEPRSNRAKQLARKVEHLIRNADYKIAERNGRERPSGPDGLSA